MVKKYDNSVKLVKPVTPYNKAIPKSKIAAIKEPVMKYFKPASQEYKLLFLEDANT